MIGLTVLLVLGAAAYRGTQLLVHDTVLDAVRDRVFAWHARRPESHVRTAVITLISCTYCTGWWVAGAALAAYLTAVDAWPDTTWWRAALTIGIQWLAVAGVQALLNRWDDTRPTRAEGASD